MRTFEPALVTQLTRSHRRSIQTQAEAQTQTNQHCEFSKNVNRRSLFHDAPTPKDERHPQRPRRLRFSFFKTKLSKNRWKPIAQKPPTQTKRPKPPSTSGFSREPSDRINRPTSPPYMASPTPNARAKPKIFWKTKPASPRKNKSPPSRSNPYGNPSRTAQGKNHIPNPSKPRQPAQTGKPRPAKKEEPATGPKPKASDPDIKAACQAVKP